MVNVAKPRVYLMTKPQIEVYELARFLNDYNLPDMEESIRGIDTDDSYGIVEIAARLCYMSYGKGRKYIQDFIDNLLSMKHGSVFEHVNYGFLITGVSRSFTHELVRHRAGFAYSQQSQRYVDESNAAFVFPPALEYIFADELQEEMTNALESYKKLLDIVHTDDRKSLHEAARCVLPNATETKIFVTGNVRAWRHFLEVRGAEYADAEMRRIAVLIFKRLYEESPFLFKGFRIMRNGLEEHIHTDEKYSKV